MKSFPSTPAVSFVCALVCAVVFALPAPARAQSFFTDFSRAVGNLFAPKIEGSGNVVQQTREFGAFHTVRIDAPFSVDIDCSPNGEPSVFIQADDNILPLISTTMSGGVLTISLDNEINARGIESKHLKVLVRAPFSENAELLGVGSVHLSNVHRAVCNITLHGIGSLTASGSTEKLTVNGNGVGSIDAKRLKAQSVQVSSHGIGSTSVYASTNLDIDLGGIGSLTYYGNPQNVKKNAGGIGSVRKGSARVEP
jgi:hypothetical protein